MKVRPKHDFDFLSKKMAEFMFWLNFIIEKRKTSAKENPLPAVPHVAPFSHANLNFPRI
jgi:hypothetical protein